MNSCWTARCPSTSCSNTKHSVKNMFLVHIPIPHLDDFYGKCKKNIPYMDLMGYPMVNWFVFCFHASILLSITNKFKNLFGWEHPYRAILNQSDCEPPWVCRPRKVEAEGNGVKFRLVDKKLYGCIMGFGLVVIFHDIIIIMWLCALQGGMLFFLPFYTL